MIYDPVFGLICFLLILWGFGLWTMHKNEVNSEVLSATYDKATEVLTVKRRGGTCRYKGECTVWKHYPMMHRCDTSLEKELLQIWEYIRTHGNPYPTAHLSKV